MQQLFEPITLRCGLVLANRIALAPMTNGQSLADGTLGDDELNWLARRADGGFGLIETCAANVSLDGKAWAGELGVDRDDELPGLTRLAARIKGGGAAAIAQIFHGGVRASSALSGSPVWSASTWREDAPTFEAPRAATIEDIDARHRSVRRGGCALRARRLRWRRAPRCARLSARPVHVRDDEPARRRLGRRRSTGRARLIREVMRAVRARVDRGFAVGVRLSLEDWGQARGLDLDESLAIARGLAADGADWIHVSLWNFAPNTKKRPDVHPIAAVREAVPRDVAIIAAGSIWTAAEARSVLERGADIVSLGRAAILNPDWPKLAAQPGWEPLRPPMTRAALLERAVSPQFAQYLTRWKNFVAE